MRLPRSFDAIAQDATLIKSGPKTGRYRVERRLGEGAFGEVYEVEDLQDGGHLALKLLRRSSPEALFRFKKEFRSLSDITHPNLVRLHELVSEEAQWFFTMELVRGETFDVYLRRDPAHLREAFRQLAEGLSALHRAGKLHRDLKPSNVLIEKGGRVVILDFGLVKELSDKKSTIFAGTPSYMSPEQCGQRPVSEASDWYTVGVMLYFVLSGTLPHSGSIAQLLQEKQKERPVPVKERVADAPEDLAALCDRLLNIAPEARPGADEIRLCLGKVSAPSVPIEEIPLFGRETELQHLQDLFDEMLEGETRLAYVTGRAGFGKTALVKAFLSRAQLNAQTLIIKGRCYEREAVRYKVFDSLVDALTTHLASLPRLSVEQLLPRDVTLLSRVFPSLGRVKAIDEAPQPRTQIKDGREQRRRAFDALAELLSRIADRRPLILFVDDLQWGDRDSGSILAHLLARPAPPAVLMIFCHRAEGADASPFSLERLRAILGPRRDTLRVISAKPMSSEALASMTAFLVGEPEPSAGSRKLAEEAEGRPLFVRELARFKAERAADEAVNLREALLKRIGVLSERERDILNIIAVAGGPVELSVLGRALGSPGQVRAQVSALSGRRFVITFETMVEIDHDRVREIALEAVTDALKISIHRRLAEALEAEGADPEQISHHLRDAGEHERAAEFALSAASSAVEGLAFRRAAHLYRAALDMGRFQGETLRETQVALGDALTSAGLGAEGAKLYSMAARSADPATRISLEHRAMEQLLFTGRVNKGLRMLERVSEQVGIVYPRTTKQAIALLMAQRALIALSSKSFKEKQSAPSELLLKIDTCWTAVSSLLAIEPIRAIYYHALGLRLARKAGDKNRYLRSLAAEGAVVGLEGTASSARAIDLLERACGMIDETCPPTTKGFVLFAYGTMLQQLGRFQESEARFDETRRILQEECTGVAYPSGILETFSLRNLFYLGEIRELQARAQLLRRDFFERGDFFAEAQLCTDVYHLALLSDDNPVEAEAEITTALERFGDDEGFQVQHVQSLKAQAEIRLYKGESKGAFDGLAERWDLIKPLAARGFQHIRILVFHLRARCALAAQKISDAESSAEIIEREATQWGAGLAALIRAGVLAASGESSEEIVKRLQIAERLLTESDQSLYASAAAWWRGRYAGDEATVQRALRSMAERGIAKPEGMLNLLAPGFSKDMLEVTSD